MHLFRQNCSEVLKVAPQGEAGQLTPAGSRGTPGRVRRVCAILGDNMLWCSRALLQGAGLTPETSNVAALLHTAREVRFFWYKKYYMPQIKIQKMPCEIRTALQKNTHHVS